MKAKLDGVTLFYELAGEGSPLTLVHGLGGSTEGWAEVVPPFAERHRVLTFDVRGFGRSDKPDGPFTPALFAADLRALLRHVGIKSTAVVGISMGGVIAQRFALDYPDAVKALVLISTSSKVGAAATAAWEETAAAVERGGMEALRDRPVRSYSPGFLRDHPDRVEELLRRRERNDPSAYARAARAVSAYDYTEELTRLSCPTLVIQGTADELTPPGGSVIMARSIPGSRLVMVEGCGHAVTVEQPQRLVREVLGFINEVERGSAVA